MSEKIIGYFLLILGLAIILFSVNSVYRVFTAKAKPAKLFNFPAISLDASSLGLPAQSNVKAEIVPAVVLNDSMNMFTHLFLMGFIAGIGSKLANIGTSLLRPIIVKAKNG